MMEQSPVRVLIADNHQRSRAGLRALLATAPGIEVIDEATDGQEAVQLAEAYRPDVILMDAGMPIMNGLEATRQIKSIWPSAKVLILTISTLDQFDVVSAGADGYFVKGESVEKLLTAILSSGI